MKTGQKKHNNFVRSPVGDKPVTEIAGIGTANGVKLSQKGFRKAHQLVDKYREMQKDCTLFVEWLTKEIGLQRYHATMCSNCINDHLEKSDEELQNQSAKKKIDAPKKEVISVGVKYKEIMERLRDDLEESLEDKIKDGIKEDGSKEDGSLKMHITFGRKNKKTIKYIFNPLKYAWSQHQKYIEQMPSKVDVLFVGMNPAPKAPSGIPFGDETMIWDIFEMNIAKEKWDKIPEFFLDMPTGRCNSGRFWKFIKDHFEYTDIEKFQKNCFVMNVSPLFFVGAGGENISLEEVPHQKKPLLKLLIDRSKQALKEAIELLKPKLIVTVGGYAKMRVNDRKIEKRFMPQLISHPSHRRMGRGPKGDTKWIKKVTGQLGGIVHSTIDSA